MKVTITIKVEKDNTYWDETAVEEIVSMSSDNDLTLSRAVYGALTGMSVLIEDAITERRRLADVEAKEENAGATDDTL